LAEALLFLTEHEATPLAGGQSLIPLLNFRLARPSLLVDLNPIAELADLRESDGALRIGALTRQATVERSAVVRRGWPLLSEAVKLAGHPATRSRGTIGGSVANADPRAELPVALAALDAKFELRSANSARTLHARELFRGPMRTAIKPGELLVEIVVPPAPVQARTAFVEYARTHGDFALAGAAVVLARGQHCSIALLGAGSVPVRATAAEHALLAGAGLCESARLAGELASAGHRRAVVTELVRRALERTCR
jgi:CO/xanthine dehydrogenase FAD-binding subunit